MIQSRDNARDAATRPAGSGVGPVQDVLARLRDLTGDGPVSLRALLGASGEASFAPALIVPALLVVSPLSGIPLFSSICGLTIALIALQMIVSRDHLWLPDVLMRRTVPGRQLRSAIDRLQGAARWLDRHSHSRGRLLFRRPFAFVPQLACVLCGAAMPFLELVPFSSSILGTAVVLFSIGFLARDGAFALAGLVVMGLAALVPVFVISSLDA